MAKFSELITGIAKDLVKVQASSDFSSMELVPHYQGNDLLNNIDIPRFRLTDINIKLKFSIAEEFSLQQTDSSIKSAELEWLKILKTEVLSEIIKTAVGIPIKEKRLVINTLFKKIENQVIPDLDIGNALKSDSSNTVTNSTKFIIEIFMAIPEQIRNRLFANTSLNNIINEKVVAAFNSKISLIRKVASSEANVERDMEIIIEKDALESVSNEKIHEISFNLTPDFIRLVSSTDKKS